MFKTIRYTHWLTAVGFDPVDTFTRHRVMQSYMIMALSKSINYQLIKMSFTMFFSSFFK